MDKDEGNGHRNSFYTSNVYSSGCLTFGNTFTGYPDASSMTGKYLTTTDTSIPYYVEGASTESTGSTAKNTVKVAMGNSVDVKFATLDGSALPAACTYYLVCTSTEGQSNLTVTAYSKSNKAMGSTTISIGDWSESNSTTKQNVVVSGLYRMKTASTSSKYTTPSTTGSSSGWGGQSSSSEYNLNRLEAGYCLQKIVLNIESTEEIDHITITNNNVYTGDEATWDHIAHIFAITAITKEVTVIDSETTSDYLVDETNNNAAIANGVKARVNMSRTMKADQWNGFVFPFNLTKAQVKQMFGENAVVAKACDDSYNTRTLTFRVQEASADDHTLIEAGSYYLVKGVTVNDDNIYSADYVTYNAFTKPADYTIKNQNTQYSDQITFHGAYYNNSSLEENGYALSSGKFYCYTDKPSIKGFRFWFSIENQTEQAKSISLAIADANDATGISTIDSADDNAAPAAIYTIDGRLVRQGASTDGLARGLYIVGGKKVMVK